MLTKFAYKALAKPFFAASLRQFSKVNIQLGAIAESISEATVKEFEKKVGDYVEVDEVVAVFETAKNDAQVRSTEAGVLAEILVAEGDDVEVGTDIFVIDTDGKKPDGGAPAEKDKATEAEPTPAQAEKDKATKAEPTPAPAEQNKATKAEPTPAPKASTPPPPRPDVKKAAPAPKPKGETSGAPGRTERREKM